MSEHLNSEEIALELTQIYSKNHSEVAMSNKGNTYPLSSRDIGSAYQFFLKIVEHDLKFEFSKSQKKDKE